MGPKQTDREKKHCVMAAYHTFGCHSLSQSGVTKKRIPLTAPSKVTDLISRAIMTTYGNIARKYAALPVLFIPRKSTTNIDVQLRKRQIVSCQDGVPMPSSMESYSFRTIFLRTVLVSRLEIFLSFFLNFRSIENQSIPTTIKHPLFE